MSGSILDEQGDVRLYKACDGTWVFRDNVCHGLRLRSGWRLFRDGETEPAVQLKNVGDRNWVAVCPGGNVAARHDTSYGLVARMARRLLVPARCCMGEAL